MIRATSSWSASGRDRDVGGLHEVAHRPLGPADHQVLERQDADEPPVAVDHEDLVEVLDFLRLPPDLVQRLPHGGRVAHGHQCGSSSGRRRSPRRSAAAARRRRGPRPRRGSAPAPRARARRGCRPRRRRPAPRRSPPPAPGRAPRASPRRAPPRASRPAPGSRARAAAPARPSGGRCSSSAESTSARSAGSNSWARRTKVGELAGAHQVDHALDLVVGRAHEPPGRSVTAGGGARADEQALDAGGRGLRARRTRGPRTVNRSPALGIRPAHSARSPADRGRPARRAARRRSAPRSPRARRCRRSRRARGRTAGAARTSSSCSSKISPTSSSSRSSSVAMPERAAELVEHDGEVAALALHVEQQVAAAPAGRRHRDRPHRQRIAGLQPEQIERVQHADDLVERARGRPGSGCSRSARRPCGCRRAPRARRSPRCRFAASSPRAPAAR